MNNGKHLLWFDKDPKHSLLHKIHQAIDYYIKKYPDDPRPNLVKVNPLDMPNDWEELDGIAVETAVNVLRNHVFVGCK